MGRIGATERPPWATVVDSGRGLTGPISEDVDDSDAFEDVETVRTGEKEDIAEPGRAGTFLLAIAAFFWAIIVSLNEGFGGPVVLLENPKPGRAVTVSAFLGEFGLSGAFSKSLACVASKVAMILKLFLAAFPRQNTQRLTHLLWLARSAQKPSKSISYFLERLGLHLQGPF